MHNGAPDRWPECPPHGELIDGTFIPLKTPLGENVEVPSGFEFTPEKFLSLMSNKKITIGLIINLCNTERYYDSLDFEEQGIEYKHITCRGVSGAPTSAEQSEFIRTCRTFLTKYPNKVIAVHCTHGCNRTGFMICSFLCSERDWAVDAAVSHFSSKRPPGIYKQDYLNELFNIFGDCDDPVPEAPTRPQWDSRSSPQPNTATIKTEFYEGITDVILVRDEALKQRIYSRCCYLCNYRVDGQIKFPGAQPVSMDLKNIQLLKTQAYRVSWKADGSRYMMYVEDRDNVFFLTRSLQLWRVQGRLEFPKNLDREKISSYFQDTLFDGEMVTDTEQNGNKVPRYLIYDVISVDGNIVAHENFDKRFGHIANIINGRRKAKHYNLIPQEGEPFKVYPKGFFPIEKSQKTWHMNVSHEKDGLIYQPVEEPYTGGTCAKIMKWKPPHLNSIDFKMQIREERQNGCLPEVVASLHVSNKAEPMVKFKLGRDQQSYSQYNNKIVEMSLVNQKWTVLRERTDKLTANSYETAVATFNSIRHPVTEDYLFRFIATEGFGVARR